MAGKHSKYVVIEPFPEFNLALVIVAGLILGMLLPW